MDAYPESGGQNLGPTPLEAFLASLATCSAMDVISILKKKQQQVSEYRLEVEYERGPEGVFPRPVTSINIRHIVNGVDIDPNAVARAIELSETKYCAVLSTLREPPQVHADFKIVAAQSMASK